MRLRLSACKIIKIFNKGKTLLNNLKSIYEYTKMKKLDNKNYRMGHLPLLALFIRLRFSRCATIEKGGFISFYPYLVSSRRTRLWSSAAKASGDGSQTGLRDYLSAFRHEIWVKRIMVHRQGVFRYSMLTA